MSQMLIVTGENSLFWTRDGESIPLRCTGITELLLKDQDKGTVTLVGYLPEALELRNLKQDDIIEVVHCCEGVIIRLEILNVVRRIPNPVILRAAENMRLSLEVIADCRVTFLFRLDRPEEV